VAQVLVVEDDRDMQGMLAALLRGEGHEVLLAESGEAALSRLARTQPDLVVLDLVLPGVNGVEVCRRAQEFTYIPIIVVTGKDTEVDKIIGLEAGADDYLTKPFQPGELRARVRALLRRSLEWQKGVQADRSRVERGALALGSRAVSSNTPQRAAGAHPPGVRPAVLPGVATWRGVLPRSSSGGGLGRGGVHRHPRDRRSHQPAAEEDRAGSGQPGVAGDRARRWVQVGRRPVAGPERSPARRGESALLGPVPFGQQTSHDGAQRKRLERLRDVGLHVL